MMRQVKLATRRELTTAISQFANPGTIFQQEWWLEAAAGDGLKFTQVQWDGITVGRLYFVARKVAGLKLLGPPEYTRTLGPYLFVPPSKPETRSANVRRIVRELVAALPKHDRFQMFLEPGDETAFAFAMAGCMVELDFTFRLDKSKDMDRFWAGLNQKTRNLLRTAEKRLEVIETADAELHFDLSLREHAGKNYHAFDTLRRLIGAAQSRGRATILVARNEAGLTVASSVLIWDDEQLYYWLSSRDPEASGAGANSLLIWKAIQVAKSKRLSFDFDGYYSLAEARFATRFGLMPVERHSVISLSTRGYLARRVASMMKRPFGSDKISHR